MKHNSYLINTNEKIKYTKIHFENIDVYDKGNMFKSMMYFYNLLINTLTKVTIINSYKFYYSFIIRIRHC